MGEASRVVGVGGGGGREEVEGGSVEEAEGGSVGEVEGGSLEDGRRVEEKDSRVWRGGSSGTGGWAIRSVWLSAFVTGTRSRVEGKFRTGGFLGKDIAGIIIVNSCCRETPSDCTTFPAPRLLLPWRGTKKSLPCRGAESG